MKSKALLALVLVFLMVFASACSSNTADANVESDTVESSSAVASNESNEEEASYKIGFSVPTQQEERWVKCVGYMKAIFEDEYPQHELIVQIADGDSQKQYSQIENLIAQNIDMLIVAPEDISSIGPVLDRCHEEGILIIGYTRVAENCWTDGFFDFDMDQAGQLQAGGALEVAPEGNYVLLGGASMTPLAIPSLSLIHI